MRHLFCRELMVEQARVELASYRIAKRLSTRLCRNYLTACPSATERTYRQKSKFRRPADLNLGRMFYRGHSFLCVLTFPRTGNRNRCCPMYYMKKSLFMCRRNARCAFRLHRCKFQFKQPPKVSQRRSTSRAKKPLRQKLSK